MLAVRVLGYARRVQLSKSLGVIMLSVLTHSLAFAQAPAPAPAPTPVAPEDAAATHDEDRAARARAAFTAGMERFRAGDHRGAIVEFERTAALIPSADVWFNIARSYEELHEYAPAIENYRRYLRDRVDPPDRADVLARIAHLEEAAETERLGGRQAPTTGELRVHAEGEGAAITVDERAVGTTPLDLAVSLPAGRHDFEATSEGSVPFRASVRVDPGMTTAARVTLVPRTEYRAVRGRRVATWIVYALGAVALGTSIGIGARAGSLNRDGNREEAADVARRADYVFGASLALGVGGTILYFAEGRAVETERVEEAP